MSQSTSDRSQGGTLRLIGTLSVAALAIAVVAIMFGGDDGDSTVSAGADTPTHVSLTEFAITPSSVTVPAGGSLHVTNDGTATHNLRVVDTDLITPDLAAGEARASSTSRRSTAGSYELLCEIAGHADAGMTGVAHGHRGRRRGGGASAEGGEHAHPATTWTTTR